MRLSFLLAALALAASPATRLATAFEAYAAHRDRQAMATFGTLAAENSAIAETMLGAMYANGRAGRVDHAIAAAYWLRAAERGYPPAQLALARALVAGRGVRRDRPAAYEWASIAARRADGVARAEAVALARAIRPMLGAADAKAREVAADDWRPWPAAAAE